MNATTDKGWTLGTLKKHLESMMGSRDKAVDTALTAAEKAVAAALAAAKEAVTKAELASERRFEAVNEFRKALTDQTATFIPRAEVSIIRDAMGEKVDALNLRLTAFENRSKGRGDGWGIFAGTMGMLIGVGGIAIALLRH